MINRHLLKRFDFFLLFLTVGVSVYGLVIIYSATRAMDLPDPYYLVVRQAIWLGVGLAGILAVNFFNYNFFAKWSKYFYAFILVLLGVVLVIGRGPGVRSWIDIGIIDIQPSEHAKLILIIFLARILSDKKSRLENRFTAIIMPLVYTFVLVGLVSLQPDLGTAMVLVAILLGMLFVAGTGWRYLFFLVGAGLVLMPIMWHFLKDYQKMRLIVFLNPGADPLGAGYQLTQSMIAIGSGWLWGKGLFEGSQARLMFLPEQHTDFIFSVLGEELGFVGAVVLLVVYMVIIYRIFWISSRAMDSFGALVCSGVAFMLVFQIMVNIGMAIGIMPVTGLPLPFMSYGGNSLLVNCLSIGLVINIGMRRHKTQF